MVILSHLSVVTGILSAVFWVISSRIKSRKKPGVAVLTMGTGEGDVDMHNLILSIRLQSKWNSRAAIFAAISVLFQALSQTCTQVG